MLKNLYNRERVSCCCKLGASWGTKWQRRVTVDQEYVEAPTLIIVCSNTSRSEKRYGQRGREFYSVIDGAFTSMLILLTAVNERIGAGFVGTFEDDKVSEILKLPRYVKPIGIITLGYPNETEPVERFERIAIDDLIHYERWQGPFH